MSIRRNYKYFKIFFFLYVPKRVSYLLAFLMKQWKKKTMQNLNFIINSPLEQFEVTSLIGLNAPIFGYLNTSLTNLGLYSLLLLFLVVGLHYMGNNETKIIPNKWSISLESSFASLSSMVREQIGVTNEIFLLLLYLLRENF